MKENKYLIQTSESVLCKWTKYGNLSDIKGINSKPFFNFLYNSFKNMLFYIIQDWVVLRYITLNLTKNRQTFKSEVLYVF